VGKKKTILVVDDMSQIRNILRFSLKKEGYNVILAENGKEALNYAQNEYPIDLVILDIMMPKMDGYEVIKQLKDSDATKHIPVIFLTAKAQKKDIVKGIEAGGNDYVVKPFKFLNLHRKIKKLIDMHNGNLKIETGNLQYLNKAGLQVSGRSARVFHESTTQETINSVNKSTPVRSLAAIMITDIVGFSKEMENNEQYTYSKLLIHNEIIRKIIEHNKGEEIKTIGDAFLVRFKSAVDAIESGMDIQKEFLKYNKDKEGTDHIFVRIGIHIGDILIRDNDVFGNGVNIASRIVPLADPGGICISADVYNIVKSSIDIKVLSLGKKELKNIKDSPEIFKIFIESNNCV
jgi:DNA-binding response OmpR family regulator